MSTADRIANAEQIEYWNQVAGPKWVRMQEMIDSQIEGLGRMAMDAAGVADAESVLDVGCGCGTTTLQIARQMKAGHSVGIDISRPMLDLARERAQREGITNARFEEADAQVHSFHGNFEVLFSRFGVMFFEDPARAFANLRGALRLGGRLSFVCWQSPQKNPWMSIPMMIAMKHVTIEMPTNPDGPGPFAFQDADRVHRILRSAGFGAISIEDFHGDIPVGGGLALPEVAKFILEFGPAGRALAEAGPEVKEAIKEEIVQLMEAYSGPSGVMMPAATWLVTAEN
jgi:ubiquinone/menaquinone biosynthesis C-methylase UbiE